MTAKKNDAQRPCGTDCQRRGKRRRHGVRWTAGLAVEGEMSDCKCEHWQACTACKPDMFDDNGNMLTFPPPPSKETLEAAGHRLALELECLLLDCKDNVVVSRWMDTACEAIDAWKRLFPYNGPRLGD